VKTDFIHRVLRFLEGLYQDPGAKIKTIVILFPLFLISLAFGLVVSLRTLLFRVGIFRSKKFPVPVICVGNIMVGGQGKTPVVLHLAERIKDAGIPVAVVSRGYGYKVTGDYLVVSGNDGVYRSSGEAPDEALMTARRLPGVPVIVAPERRSAIAAAIELFGAKIVIMDDGFQHLKVKRDINILVMDGKNPTGNGLILPAGPLREPLRAIKRADALWINGRTKDGGNDERWGFLAKKYLGLESNGAVDIPVIKSEYVPQNILSRSGGRLPLSSILKKKVLVFSGIARPDRFFKTVEELGAIVVYKMPFRDHYMFQDRDFQAIIYIARRFGAELLVTTEKDFSRIPEDIQLSIPLYALAMGLSAKGDDAILNIVISEVRGGR